MKSSDFKIKPGQSVSLAKLPTRIPNLYSDKAEYESLREGHMKELQHLQNKLYAHDHYALLVIFQAMDAAGKDSAIKHVMSGVNPQGCQVFSFKEPSREELDHDFLWRVSRCLPERGRIGIFNRSYYEETLVVRVHQSILDAQRLPEEIRTNKKIWEQRYESMADFERHLHNNGTRVVKFFLHVSREEQRKRFIERIDDPEKHWKFSAADVRERGFWAEYQEAYAETIAATSTKEAPWYVIPADEKKSARLLMSDVLIETLKDLNLEYPPPGETPEELLRLRTVLVDEK